MHRKSPHVQTTNLGFGVALEASFHKTEALCASLQQFSWRGALLKCVSLQPMQFIQIETHSVSYLAASQPAVYHNMIFEISRRTRIRSVETSVRRFTDGLQRAALCRRVGPADGADPVGSGVLVAD